MDRVGLVAGAAAVAFAVALGIYSTIYFTHREVQTCTLFSVSGPKIDSGRFHQKYWDVISSCGDDVIITGRFFNDRTTDPILVASLRTDAGHNSYRIQFQGWAPGRNVVSVQPVN